MLENPPSPKELESLIGSRQFQIWVELCNKIDCFYNMEHIWNNGGKKWKYEYKYRRGGKTLCALYARENCFGFMIIFGKAERKQFEAEKENYSKVIQQLYENSTTYHDGKWMMFELEDSSLFPDLIKLLAIKRKPNKK